MRAYPLYDETGIKWNTKKPSHWAQICGKRFFCSKKEKNIGNKEKNILSLTLKGVIRNSADRPIGLSPSDYSTYQVFEKGDLVFKLIDLNNISTSRVGLVPERGIMSSAYIRLTAKHDCNIRFFYLQYYDLWLRNIYNGLGAGVRQTLGDKDLLELDILIPPRDEQDQIVKFLDWKVSKINKLINIRKKQIEKLEELKKSIVSHAVTHGLDSNVGMKDSGVKWIEKIPIHWDMKKIGALFTERKSKVSDKDYPPLSVAKIGVVPQLSTAVKTNAGDDRKLVRTGDFVINSRSDRKGSCGVSYFDGSVSLVNIILTPRFELNANYVHYLLRSQPFAEEFYRNGKGIVGDLWTTRYSEMKSILLPVPPTPEQAQIADYLREQTKIIDCAIMNKKTQIEKLHDLKSRLISDVVTGKIDVRGIKIPEYESVDEEVATDIEDIDVIEEQDE